MADIKLKIRKLLALAESPNENEARNALLKARALMAQHKLREIDLKDVGKQEVIRVETGVTCTAMTDFWAATLARIIAENYCCTSARAREDGKKTNSIMLYGFEEDVAVAKEIFLYAYNCVKNQCKRIRKEKKAQMWSGADIRKGCNSYGYGFAKGVSDAYEAQKSEHQEWGLVLQVPAEVMDFLHNRPGFKKTAFGKLDRRMSDLHEAGREEGKKFSPNTKLRA